MLLLTMRSRPHVFFEMSESLRGWIFLFFLGCLLLEVGGDDQKCEKLKRFMDTKKLAYISHKDSHIGVRRPCGREGRVCCSAAVEDLLTGDSRRELVTSSRSDINQLYSLLNTRARRFNDFFTTLLLESKKDFDEMFRATYGIAYEENAYVFSDFFEKLEEYYSKGHVDLEKAIDHFFSTLYQKMFTVLNSPYQFDEKYLACVGDHMKDLKPFGDVPQKLSVQIKRSFVATRTLAQSLNIAKDIVLTMQNLGAAGDCSMGLMRMSRCQLCRDVSDAKPCSGLCLNVMKGCLAYQTELDLEWNHFVGALFQLINRLLGPFNIENVVEPIDIKISEAIMNFQENSVEVSEKVFNGCGRPLLNRRVRETREIELGSYQFSREAPRVHNTMEKLLREIRAKVNESHGFWGNLPYRICNQEPYAVGGKDDNKQCWNGTAVARYTRSVTGKGLNSQASNPEVSLDTSRPKTLLNEQIHLLRSLTSKIRNAYNGYDVQWHDIEESRSSQSLEHGSGEGSGDDEVVHEGSGRGPHDPYDDNEPGGEDDPVDGSVPGPPSITTTTTLSPNNESNVIPVLPAMGSRPTSRASIIHRPQLFRVVTSYVLPIYVIWLGGLFSEWL